MPTAPKVPDLEVTMIELDQLVPDPNNPRNNSGAIEIIAASIRRFGFLVPIVVDGENNIVAGHARYLAARMLKLVRAPTVSAAHLSPEQLREFSIAENRTSDFSFFDVSKLAEFAVDLPEEFIADFDIESLLSTVGDYEAPAVSDQAPEKREGLDLAPFEKYQYVTIICRSTYDYTNLLERLGLEDIQARYVGKYLKRGQSTGRIIEYPDFVRKIDG